MTDIWNASRRSEVMSNIRSKDTKPELMLRSSLHRAGVRFRLHRADLPGKPYIVFPCYRAVVFVHGCFWHQHKKCRDGVLPKSNAEYWAKKLLKNVQNDHRSIIQLKKLGWTSFVM